MSNTDTFSNELYKKIRNRFSSIEMVDDKDKITLDSKSARIFNMPYVSEDPTTIVTLSLMKPSALQIWFDRNMVKNFDDETKTGWFEFLQSLRKFTVTRSLSFDLLDIDRPGLTTKDIKSLITTHKATKADIQESKFTPMFGSKRSSYQKLEHVKIKVRHGKVINDDIHGARSRNIKALYIENNQNERFKFPFVNLAGVRAMARHMEEGGNWNDHIGQHIISLTENLVNIKNFARAVRKDKLMAENTLPLFQKLRECQINYRRKLHLMSGSHGYHSYKQNLAETYVEPVESVINYFPNITPAVEACIPSIERILGERQVESMLDEAVAATIMGLVEAKHKTVRKTAGQLREKLNNEILKDLGISNVKELYSEKRKQESLFFDTWKDEYDSKNFTEPKLYVDPVTEKYWAPEKEKLKLLWLLYNGLVNIGDMMLFTTATSPDTTTKLTPLDKLLVSPENRAKGRIVKLTGPMMTSMDIVPKEDYNKLMAGKTGIILQNSYNNSLSRKDFEMPIVLKNKEGKYRPQTDRDRNKIIFLSGGQPGGYEKVYVLLIDSSKQRGPVGRMLARYGLDGPVDKFMSGFDAGTRATKAALDFAGDPVGKLGK